MNNLKQIIEDNTTKSGRIFDFFIQFLIVLSLISFCIETLPDLSKTLKRVLNTFELLSVIIFTIEYFLRIIVSDKKLRFIFSFYGLIDFFAILPFYLSTGIDLRSLRVFRLFRLFRVFKLFRYSSAIKRFNAAIKLIKTELILYLFLTLMLLFISSVGIYYFENPAQPEIYKSIFESMWWSVATLTTVGYGDIYPVTVGGKVFTFFILMIGLGIIAVPTGLLASALSKSEDREK